MLTGYLRGIAPGGTRLGRGWARYAHRGPPGRSQDRALPPVRLSRACLAVGEPLDIRSALQPGPQVPLPGPPTCSPAPGTRVDVCEVGPVPESRGARGRLPARPRVQPGLSRGLSRGLLPALAIVAVLETGLGKVPCRGGWGVRATQMLIVIPFIEHLPYLRVCTRR